jgi:hypothetical protein
MGIERGLNVGQCVGLIRLGGEGRPRKRLCVQPRFDSGKIIGFERTKIIAANQPHPATIEGIVSQFAGSREDDALGKAFRDTEKRCDFGIGEIALLTLFGSIGDMRPEAAFIHAIDPLHIAGKIVLLP